MKERWKEIDGHPGHFVSNLGRVKRKMPLGREKMFSEKPTAKGIRQVQFKWNGIPCGYKVARLVAAAFLKDFDPEKVVMHKDGDTTNCAVTNLVLQSRSDLVKGKAPGKPD